MIFMFVLEKTTFGRRVYTTGSNEQSAKLAGINVNRKMLADLAVSDEAAFAKLVETAKAKL